MKKRNIEKNINEKGELRSLLDLFSKQIGSLVGLLLLFVTIALGLSLLSWSAQDPSLSFANDHEVTNKLGYIGAIYSDLSMQFFGLAGAFILVPLFCWSLYLILQKLDFSLLRCFLNYPLFLCFFCFAFSLYSLSLSTTLPQGLGGILGQFCVEKFSLFLPLNILWFQIFLGFLNLFLGFFCFFVSCGLLFKKRDTKKNEFKSKLGFWEGWFGFFYHIRLFAYKTFLRLCSFIFRKIKNLVIREKKEEIKISLKNDPKLNISSLEAQKISSLRYEENLSNPEAIKFTTHSPFLQKQTFAFQETIENNDFILPSFDHLTNPERRNNPRPPKSELEKNSRRLYHVLQDFGIEGRILSISVGPVVTLYEFEPAPGIKSSRIISLCDDIARSMCAVSARVSVIAGRNAIGIELPNEKRETVYLREILESETFFDSSFSLALALGKKIDGEIVVADLAKMPHLLVAGTTGSGKSVAIHSMILSLLYRLSPEKCRFIMIDPKMLELSIYDGIPHLLAPVVTDPKKSVIALRWAVKEMEERYAKMAKAGVRNIEGFNEKIKEAHEREEDLVRKIQTGFDQETGQPIFETETIEKKALPYIVVIIDEMADLMLVAGKEIEAAVQRLAQMARAAGIHVLMATQRPSVDVITGTIKANFPTRISFQVTSKIDSRTILGEQGAEQLLGQGDMLFMSGGRRLQRVHGPFVFDQEVHNIVQYLKSQGVPQYLGDITADKENGDLSNDTLSQSHDLYDQAVAIMLKDKKISISYIQRRLGIGYNRAASIVERMEEEGLIGPANHIGKREILVQLDC